MSEIPGQNERTEGLEEDCDQADGLIMKFREFFNINTSGLVEAVTEEIEENSLSEHLTNMHGRLVEVEGEDDFREDKLDPIKMFEMFYASGMDDCESESYAELDGLKKSGINEVIENELMHYLNVIRFVLGDDYEVSVNGFDLKVSWKNLDMSESFIREKYVLPTEKQAVIEGRGGIYHSNEDFEMAAIFEESAVEMGKKLMNRVIEERISDEYNDGSKEFFFQAHYIGELLKDSAYSVEQAAGERRFDIYSTEFRGEWLGCIDYSQWQGKMIGGKYEYGMRIEIDAAMDDYWVKTVDEFLKIKDEILLKLKASEPSIDGL